MCRIDVLFYYYYNEILHQGKCILSSPFSLTSTGLHYLHSLSPGLLYNNIRAFT